MTFFVRIFAHEGLAQMRLILPVQHTEDTVFQLTQPYLWSAVLTTNGATPVASAPDATPRVTILRIEVADGNSIRYEINPSGRNVSAGNASPILSGHDNYLFAPGWSISIVDAASFP